MGDVTHIVLSLVHAFSSAWDRTMLYLSTCVYSKLFSQSGLSTSTSTKLSQNNGSLFAAMLSYDNLMTFSALEVVVFSCLIANRLDIYAHHLALCLHSTAAVAVPAATDTAVFAAVSATLVIVIRVVADVVAAVVATVVVVVVVRAVADVVAAVVATVVVVVRAVADVVAAVVATVVVVVRAVADVVAAVVATVVVAVGAGPDVVAAVVKDVCISLVVRLEIG